MGRRQNVPVFGWTFLTLCGSSSANAVVVIAVIVVAVVVFVFVFVFVCILFTIVLFACFYVAIFYWKIVIGSLHFLRAPLAFLCFDKCFIFYLTADIFH